MIIWIIVGIAVLLLLSGCVRIVPQSQAYVIERLGAYRTTWETGIRFKAPIIDRVANKVSLKEKIADFPPQSVITKDNATVGIDTVIYYQILDPKLYTYGAEDPIAAIKNLTATTLRNLIGELNLDETLTSRDTINSKLRSILDEATDAWGIKIKRVEIKDIIPPKQIQESMEKEMKAERDRRASVLRAEGEKTSSILIAEGAKQSAILRAEAEKESAILRAEAEKLRNIKEAEGKAEAIRIVQKAMADGIRMINEAKPSKEFIALKSLEAFEKISDGQATKIIIPSDIQNIAGLIASAKEIIETENDEKKQEMNEKKSEEESQ